jgi:hypothetical protein
MLGKRQNRKDKEILVNLKGKIYAKGENKGTQRAREEKMSARGGEEENAYLVFETK